MFSHRSQRLSGFVVISMVAHLLLLGYWFQSSTPQLITSSPLSVILLQSQNVQQDEQTSKLANKSEKAKPAHSNTETKTVVAQMQTAERVVSKGQAVITAPAPQTQSGKSITTTMIAESAAFAPTSAPPQIVMQLEQSGAKQPPQPQTDNEIVKPSLSLTQVREQLLGQLHKDLARHFYYPRLARKRGWQGEVLLNLKIESDGAISRVLITKSTGYSLLDDTAINTVKKISNIKEIGEWLNGRSIEMELPVIYRLTKS